MSSKTNSPIHLTMFYYLIVKLLETIEYNYSSNYRLKIFIILKKKNKNIILTDLNLFYKYYFMNLLFS